MPFGEDCIVINRTTKPLNYCYDGRHGVLKPGYKLGEKDIILPAGKNGRPAVQHLIFQVAEMARRQNVIAGTENPFDLREVQYLVGIAVEDEEGRLIAAPGWPENAITPCEQSVAKERLDRRLLDAEAQTAQTVRGRSFPRTRRQAEGGEPFTAGNDSQVGLDTRG